MFPFGHSPIVQDALTVQWPSLVAASIVAPEPRLIYTDKNPPPLTVLSHIALTTAVIVYWFPIGWWIDVRLFRIPYRQHSNIIKGMLILAAALTLPIFLLFLGKVILRAWPHGRQGGYGITVWFGLVCLMLLSELGVFRRREL